MQKTINSVDFRKMITVGGKFLENNRSKVDALNVFPVPDGDTGTNMSLTMQSSVREVSACSSTAFSDVCESVSKGVAMILKSVEETLQKLGVTEIEALGKTFDPTYHNAVLHVEDEAFGEGEIVEVLQKGYMKGDRILRYAMVKVAN